MDAKLNGPFGLISLTATGLTLGRAQDNQLILNDVKASSHHAQIRLAGSGFSVADIGSTNGTFVNEQKLERNVPHTLRSGDVIRIGDTPFTYTAIEEPKLEATVYSSSDNDPFQATVAAPPPSTVYQPPQGPQAVPFPQQQPGFQEQQRGYQAYNQLPPANAYNQPPANAYNQPPANAYNQPPAKPYPALPPTYGTAQPARKSRKWLWIVLGVVVLLVLIVGGLAALAGGNKTTPTPAATLDAFCSDLKKPDYHAAYGELAPTLQSQVSEASFTSIVKLQNISICSHDEPTENGDTATSHVILASVAHPSPAPLLVTLTKQDNGAWKISQVPLSPTPI